MRSPAAPRRIGQVEAVVEEQRVRGASPTRRRRRRRRPGSRRPAVGSRRRDEAGAVADDRAPSRRLRRPACPATPGTESIDQNASGRRRGADRSGRGGGEGDWSASRAQVLARLRGARSSSSASRSFARSQHNRGSDQHDLLAFPGRMSVSSFTRRRWSHGSQLSIPSNRAPSARRSHCSRPHGSGRPGGWPGTERRRRQQPAGGKISAS